MAEQLLMFNQLNEGSLLRLDLTKTRLEIGCSLLANSGSYSYTFKKGIYHVNCHDLYYTADMSERCMHCGGSENSFSIPQYADWV